PDLLAQHYRGPCRFFPHAVFSLPQGLPPAEQSGTVRVFHQVRPRRAGSSTRDGCESDHQRGFAGRRRIVEVSSRTREAPMDRRLVITADDLGVDPETNATIVELLRDGLVLASTWIPVEPAALDGVPRIKAAGVAPPRLHLTLD